MNPLFAPAAVLCLLAAAGSAQAGAPTSGRELAATCANCHGTNGHASPGAGIAPLAGKSKTTILQQLADFRSGAKPATIMHQIAKGYSAEQLDLIAGHFAEQQ